MRIAHYHVYWRRWWCFRPAGIQSAPLISSGLMLVFCARRITPSLKVCACWRGGAGRPESRTSALPIVVIRVQGSKETAKCIENWWNSGNRTRYWNSCSYNVHNCCGVAIQRYHRVRSFPCNDVVDQFMLLGLLCPMYYWLCALSKRYILCMIWWLLWSGYTRFY